MNKLTIMKEKENKVTNLIWEEGSENKVAIKKMPELLESGIEIVAGQPLMTIAAAEKYIRVMYMAIRVARQLNKRNSLNK